MRHLILLFFRASWGHSQRCSLVLFSCISDAVSWVDFILRDMGRHVRGRRTPYHHMLGLQCSLYCFCPCSFNESAIIRGSYIRYKVSKYKQTTEYKLHPLSIPSISRYLPKTPAGFPLKHCLIEEIWFRDQQHLLYLPKEPKIATVCTIPSVTSIRIRRSLLLVFLPIP